MNNNLPSKSISRTSDSWPTLHRAVLCGPAGEVVRIIKPHSEADPVAILVQTLVVYGNVIGRTAHFTHEDKRHFLNLFAVLVGDTDKGRKGTSFGRVVNLFKHIDEAWAAKCVQKGLSSGEGLIWAVRDPIEKLEPIKEKGRVTDYQNVVIDPGVDDKRLLVIEEEFASILKVMNREGNTLSPLIRQAWDDGTLQVMTKNSPVRATDAHVSFIGHITKQELNRYLGRTECGNGFANRFLWVCVKRSKYLPEGGRLQEADLTYLRNGFLAAVEFGREVGEMGWDEEARSLWYQVYKHLSCGHPGLLGAVTSRAEAQVRRLACLYALLDGSTEIRRVHLEAALALWQYCQSSAYFIFGDSLGNPVADEILRILRESDDGLTRTEISNRLGCNRSANAISTALEALHAAGQAEPIQGTSGDKGRPEERWRAVLSSENGINSFLSYSNEGENSSSLQTETSEEVTN